MLYCNDLNVASFTVLDMAESGHPLVPAENQNIDGESAVNRRGCLYLCEKFEVSKTVVHELWGTYIFNRQLYILFFLYNIPCIQSTAMITSESESDDSDIMKTSLESGVRSRKKKMSTLLAQTDELLKKLKVLYMFSMSAEWNIRTCVDKREFHC